MDGDNDDYTDDDYDTMINKIKWNGKKKIIALLIKIQEILNLFNRNFHLLNICLFIILLSV